MMPEKLQILQDQYDSALIKVAKADAQIDCLGEQERSIESLLSWTRRCKDQCFDDRRESIEAQKELLQAIEKEKGETNHAKV